MCDFNECPRRDIHLTWLNRELCERCWNRVCALTDTKPADEVRRDYTRKRRARGVRS